MCYCVGIVRTTPYENIDLQELIAEKDRVDYQRILTVFDVFSQKAKNNEALEFLYEMKEILNISLQTTLCTTL
jgi:hypothetical protein